MKGMIGTDRLANVAWTAPSLFFLGVYMQRKVGAMTMLKFSSLATFAVAASWTAFNPNKDYGGI
jgi:hypothetical protein